MFRDYFKIKQLFGAKYELRLKSKFDKWNVYGWFVLVFDGLKKRNEFEKALKRSKK